MVTVGGRGPPPWTAGRPQQNVPRGDPSGKPRHEIPFVTSTAYAIPNVRTMPITPRTQTLSTRDKHLLRRFFFFFFFFFGFFFERLEEMSWISLRRPGGAALPLYAKRPPYHRGLGIDVVVKSPSEGEGVAREDSPPLLETISSAFFFSRFLSSRSF